MIILDTNVLSELIKVAAEPRVIAWMDRQPADDVATTAITAAEMAYGVEQLPMGKRRARIAALNDAVLASMVAILPFTAREAQVYGEIVATRRRDGKDIKPLDAQIAAIAKAAGAVIATRNMRDFLDCGIDLVDPWAG